MIGNLSGAIWLAIWAEQAVKALLGCSVHFLPCCRICSQYWIPQFVVTIAQLLQFVDVNVLHQLTTGQLFFPSSQAKTSRTKGIYTAIYKPWKKQKSQILHIWKVKFIVPWMLAQVATCSPQTCNQNILNISIYWNVATEDYKVALSSKKHPVWL